MLRFGAGIQADQLKFVTAGPELHIYYGETGQIKLLNQGIGFNHLEFADGSVATLDQLARHAPVLEGPLNDADATAGIAFTTQVKPGIFTDADTGDILTYQATRPDGSALPSWLRFDAAAATFSGTPDTPDTGTFDVMLTATDSTARWATDTFKMTVSGVNVAPTVHWPTNDFTVAEWRSFYLRLPEFRDANPGDILSMAVTSADGSPLPSWMSYDPAQNGLVGITSYESAGTYAIKVTATDGGGLSVASGFKVILTDVNRAPVLAKAIPDAAASAGTALNLVVAADTFADPDTGDTLALTAKLANGAALPQWLRFDAATATFSGTPAYADIGTSNVTLRYTDAGGLAATATLALTINQAASVTLTGTAGDDTLTGKSNNDTLSGLDGNDKLNGGLGADNMAGGNGDDSYAVDNAGDVVTEAAGAGTDSVSTDMSYTLPDNVENLTLTGSAAGNGTGNALNNAITGNAGANVLDGAAGADTMAGNGGDDTYYSDHAGDAVTEWANGGFDQLFSSVSRSLAYNVEVLTLTGTGSITARAIRVTTSSWAIAEPIP